MTSFIQPLESRTLFSVTAANLGTDVAAVLADAATVKADLNQLIADSNTDDKAIALAFKGLPKAEQTLLKGLTSAQGKAKSLFTKEESALVKPADSLATKAVVIGDTLLKDATLKSLTTASKDIIELGTITSVPLATLSSQLSGTLVSNAITAILTALPSDTSLTTVVTALETAATADKTAIGIAALQFETDLGTLATDLTSVHTATGTFPPVTGVFTGTARVTSGKDSGQHGMTTLTILSQDANGLLTATVTDFDGGIDGLVGAESLNGKILLKSLPRKVGVSISGTFSGTTLTGNFTLGSDHGTFSVTETTG